MASVQQNPMLIDTVLGQLFRCTDYETLKNCRLVCQKWKNLCDRILFKKTAFAVKHYPVRSKNEAYEPIIVKEHILESALEIRSIFESINEEILFSATFKFQVDLLTPNIKDFYLEPNKTLMTSLELNITQECLHNYDNNLDDLIGPNLRRLKVTNCTPWDSLPISLDKLVVISEAVELECCNIKKNSVQKISSKVLELDRFNILLNDKVVTNPEMSDIIDFGSLQKLYLNGDYNDVKERSNHIVNLSDCQKIKSLTLLSVTVILDAQISPLELKLGDNKYTRNGKDENEFKLRNYFCSPHFDMLAILENKHVSIIADFSELTIRKLEICLGTRPIFNVRVFGTRGPQNVLSHNIDLSLLPKTVESLCFDDQRGRVDNPFTGPIILPKLKHLLLMAISRDYDDSLALPQFKGCPLLQDISLVGATVNTDHLPATVKRLSVQDMRKLEGSKEWKLDVFVFSFSSIPPSELLTAKLKTKLFKKFKADLFVFRTVMEGEDIDEETVLFIMKMKNRLKKIAFGPVREISEDVQQKFSFPEFVFQRDNYYFVEGKTGTKITKREFDNLVEWY